MAAQGRVEEAVACYEQAIARRRGCADAWFNLGAVETQRNNLPRAHFCFERVLEINPNRQEAENAIRALGANE